MRPQSFAVKHPTRLFVEHVGTFDEPDLFMMVAKDTDGNSVTIVASGTRFQSALQHPISQREQVVGMYVRGEIGVDELEREIEKGLRYG